MKVRLISALGIIALSVIAWILTFGCQPKLPGPDAVELWNVIGVKSQYKGWGQWPDHKGMQPSKSPHGPFTIIYVNGKGLSSDSVPLPYGTVIVKENYTSDKKLASITVMYKIREFNPRNNDWFWAKYSPDGKVETAGKVASCIQCHLARKDNDYIMAHELKK